MFDTNHYRSYNKVAYLYILRRNGSEARVTLDPEDVARLKAYQWRINEGKGGPYVVSGRTLLLHRFLIATPADMVCELLNRNGLDCRKQNLANTTRSALCKVALAGESPSSPYCYVDYEKRCRPDKRWRFKIRLNGRTTRVGTGYPTPEQANEARQNYLKENAHAR